MLGRVALTEPEARCLVQNLRAAGAREAAAISTCNRTELYLAGPDAAKLAALGTRELSELVDVPIDELEPVLYRLTDATASLHLNRVAAGLDSLVPGEAQVLGQVRTALAVADSEGAAGPVLSRAFQRALETGKRARSETAISAGNASVASVAASLADVALGGLTGRAALVVGAGRTSELAALNLMSRGLRRLSVANRTYQSACVLAGRLGGSAVHFEDVAEQLRRSTWSSARPRRRTRCCAPTWSRPRWPVARPRSWCSTSRFPRTSSPGSRSSRAVASTASTTSPLEIARTVALRREEAAAAEAICADAAEEFRAWQAERTVVPAIGRLRARAEALRVAEVERLSAGLEPCRARAARAAVARARRQAAAQSDDAPSRERERPGRRAVRRDRARPVRPRRRPRVAVLRLGTRGSRLALCQAGLAADALRAAGLGPVAIVPLSTIGDRDRRHSFSELGGRGVFSSELEEALRAPG